MYNFSPYLFSFYYAAIVLLNTRLFLAKCRRSGSEAVNDLKYNNNTVLQSPDAPMNERDEIAMFGGVFSCHWKIPAVTL